MLVISFIVCLRNANFDRMHVTEVIFILFSLGLALDEVRLSFSPLCSVVLVASDDSSFDILAQFASTKEHGWLFYTQSLYNGFDLCFVVVFFVFLAIRVRGLATHDAHLASLAFDTLACGATVLFPRLAFSIISGNAVLIALKQMIADFVRPSFPHSNFHLRLTSRLFASQPDTSLQVGFLS